MMLRQAIKQQKLIDVTYQSYTRNEKTRRRVEPYELIYGADTWYMRGHCLLRDDTREFRLDRIDELHLLDEGFTPRTLRENVTDHDFVRVQFAGEDRRWVVEYQNYAFHSEEIQPDGSV